MALGQHSEHGDHSAVSALLLAAVRKHAMALGQHSEHLDHSASRLEPVVCVRKKRNPVRHGLHSPCRHDQSSVQCSRGSSLTVALQRVGAPHSPASRKWKRLHSGNTP